MSDAAGTRLDEMERMDLPPEERGGDDVAIDHVGARLTRRAIASIAIGVALLLSACAVTAWLVGRNEDTAVQIFVLSDMRATAARLLEQALDAETGQRGYLITHDEAYLEPFSGAARSIRRTLNVLSERVADDPIEADIVHRLSVALDEKFNELRQTVDLEREGRHEQALAIVNSNLGKLRMDDIRALSERLDADLHDRLVSAVAQQTRTRQYMLAALAVAAIGLVGLCAAMVRDTRGQLRRLNAARSRLRTLVRTLEDRVARRTRELAEINQRFDIALQASGIVVFAQDRHLTYTWLSHSLLDIPIEQVVGKSDAQIMPARSLAAIERLKRGVIETGQSAREEISIEVDGVVRWWNLTIVPARTADGVADGIVCGAVDISQRKESEVRVRLLMSEVTHRSKNLLSVVQAIMRQTAPHSASMEDFADRFAARLNSLAASHDLLVQEDWQGVALHDLVRSQLGHFSDRVGAQIQIEGPPLIVPPQAAQHIGMALHELATNAATHGALSIAEGRVRVAWRVAPGDDGGRVCDLSWSEADGPPVTRPSRSGFGRVVIERTVARALNGKVSLAYPAEGLRWALTFPLVS